MKYPEPIQTLGTLESVNTTGTTAAINTSTHIPITVRYLENVGWEIEVEYSKKHPDFQKQVYTGAQQKLCSATVEAVTSETAIIVKASGQELSFNRNTGGFSLKEQGKIILSSAPAAFTRLPQRESLFEGIMSLKVTDFSVRNPLGPQGALFDSYMVRFQYTRPSGQVLGLPGQTGELNRNGYRFDLYNTDTFVHTPNRPPMYQSWPLLLHRNEADTGWLCVFHDNPARTFVDIGDFYTDRVTFESVIGNTRIYILTGKTLAELSTRIMTLLGDALFPPAWAFGYQQCRWSYMSTDEVRRVSRTFRKNAIPCDSIYFDIDYMDEFRVFTTDPKNFGDLKECLDELNIEGFKSICIVDPGVKVDKEYQVYKSLREIKAYLTTKSGKEFEGTVWPGTAVYPDFGDSEVREAWATLQQDWLDTYPFSGVWNDMNEPSNFDGQNATTSKALTKRGALEHEFNLYGYYMSLASYLGWHKHKPGERGVVITRAGYPGVQQHSVIWHGDNQAWWEHLRLALDTAVTYSICGAHYTGPDVPGFTGNPTDDLAVRFFQLGAFLPLYRGHSIFFANDKEPYAFAEPAREHIVTAIKLRYSLLREWYTGFAAAVKNKTALLQPVFAEGSCIRDQFLLFNTLLVAPVIERDQQQRAVYLPEGTWYRLGETETILAGNQWILEPVTLASIPVFVKAGSILTRNTPGKNVTETLAHPERYEIYRDKRGQATGHYYADDGISVNPVGTWQTLSLTTSGTVQKE